MRSASLPPGPKEQRRSGDTKQGIWSEPWSRPAPNKASTLDGFWFEQVDHLISERDRAGCKESAIASARRFIAAMAIAIRKDRAIPPRSKDAGVPGPISVRTWLRGHLSRHLKREKRR